MLRGEAITADYRLKSAPILHLHSIAARNYRSFTNVKLELLWPCLSYLFKRLGVGGMPTALTGDIHCTTGNTSGHTDVARITVIR